VDTHRETSGAVRFTITRDPKASRYSGRSAHLQVGGLQPTPQEAAILVPGGNARGVKKVLMSCSVDAEVTREGIVYRFTLDEGMARQAELQLWEANREVLGDGDVFHIRLKHFLPARAGRQ